MLESSGPLFKKDKWNETVFEQASKTKEKDLYYGAVSSGRNEQSSNTDLGLNAAMGMQSIKVAIVK